MMALLMVIAFSSAEGTAARGIHLSLGVLPIFFSATNGLNAYSQGSAFQIEFASPPLFVGAQAIGNIIVVNAERAAEIQSMGYFVAPYGGMELYHRYDPLFSIQIGGRIYLNRSIVGAYEVYLEIRYLRDNFLLPFSEPDESPSPLLSFYGVRAGYVDFPDRAYPLWFIGVEGASLFLDIPLTGKNYDRETEN